MALPTTSIAFSDLRRVIGPNNAASISLGQCRPGYPPAHGNGIIGVTDTNIAMSQFRGKSKLNNGLTFRAFQGSAYTFTAGAGGAAGFGTGGGGGGGGILVNNGGGGGAGTSNASAGGGGGGGGYGGGGGGATWYAVKTGFQFSNPPGGGAGGFVYVSLNGSELFAPSSTTYTCTSSGTLRFIMIGNGAGGGNATNIGVCGGGGAAGNLNYGTISVISGDVLTLNVSGTSSIVRASTTLASAAGGGGGSAYGGGRGGGGGNGGSGHQGSAYFNAARTSVASLGGYFADNPALFSTYSASVTGTTINMTNLTTATNSAYIANGTSTNFSVEWLGQFYPPTTGSYTFYLSSGDAAYLWLGANASSGYTTANANINNGGIHDATSKTYTVTLTASTLYPLRIQYGQSTGTYDCNFSFSGPNIIQTYLLTNYVFN